MDLVIALDGSLQRDLQWFAGDQETLNLAVFAHDAHSDDEAPLATITNPRIVVHGYPAITIPVASQFTVPSNCRGRRQYRLVAEVAGVTMTLAYGDLITSGGWCAWWGRDYGWGWGC